MANIKKITSSFVTFLLTLTLAGAPFASALDLNALGPAPAEPSFSFQIQDDSTAVQQMGVISSITGGLPGAGLATLSCASVDDPACSAAESLMVAAVIPPCSSSSTVNDICISGLESAGSDGRLLPAKLILEAKSNKFLANPTYNLPAGGGVSIWRGASTDGKELDYAITAVLRLNFYREAGRKPNALFFEFHTQITPVIVKSGNYYPKKWFTNGGRGITLGLDNPSGAPEDPYNNCLYSELGKCAMAQPFTVEQSLAIKLQMDDRLTGWLFGRMKDTAVVVKPISAQINSILVEGTSISVPAAGAWVPLVEIAKSPGLSEMDWDKGLSANKYLPKGQPASIFKSSNHPDLFEMPRFGIAIENGGGIHEPPAALKGSGMFQAVDKWLKPIGAENQT